MASPVIKSPSFKSKIPQKIEKPNREVRIPTSPTSGRLNSRIPRSTSLNYSSSFKNETEVIVQRQHSESAKTNVHERQDQINLKFLKGDYVGKRKSECLNHENAEEKFSNGKLHMNNECSYRKGYGNIEEYSKSITTVLDNTKEVPSELDLKFQNNNSWNSLLSNDTSLIHEIDSENTINNRYVIVQPVYQEIHQELSSNVALISTPTDRSSSSGIESADLKEANSALDQFIFPTTMETEGHTKAKAHATTTEAHSDQNVQNGYTTPSMEDFPDEDFERTEHDNNDYTTTTTTEYEKDGKVVKTTETVNYTNDRNIKTRVTTTEKIITIPYGQQLDLNNPEITSSTTVRSKYLQTMLQSREFEGDKEVKAETFETIETDVQTHKTDSNDNTSDPDLDTVLTIVETLDEVRTIEPKIKNFSGTSTSDPIYTELLDILNTSLSKFEDIEPKGKESVEQKRQNGIEYIQRLVLQLNIKLQENKKTTEAEGATEAPTPHIDETDKPLEKVALERELPKVETSYPEKPAAKEAEPASNTKKERKKSTLKKHFKFGNKDKDKKNEEEQKKKKKKKLCVIS